jgi:hypothetical protein
VELNGSIDGGNLVLRGTSWRIGLLIFVLALIAFEAASARDVSAVPQAYTIKTQLYVILNFKNKAVSISRI